jgi:hypothetical protein
MFTEKFDRYAYAGHAISCAVDGFECVARLYADDDMTPPDKRQDGYWSSLNPDDAGYIGAKSPSTLRRYRKREREALEAWHRGDWFYVGVSVTVRRNGIALTGKYDHAVWGCDCNHPFSKAGNDYLREVANELLGKALDDAKAKLALLVVS